MRPNNVDICSFFYGLAEVFAHVFYQYLASDPLISFMILLHRYWKLQDHVMTKNLQNLQVMTVPHAAFAIFSSTYKILVTSRATTFGIVFKTLLLLVHWAVEPFRSIRTALLHMFRRSDDRFFPVVVCCKVTKSRFFSK